MSEHVNARNSKVSVKTIKLINQSKTIDSILERAKKKITIDRPIINDGHVTEPKDTKASTVLHFQICASFPTVNSAVLDVWQHLFASQS